MNSTPYPLTFNAAVTLETAQGRYRATIKSGASTGISNVIPQYGCGGGYCECCGLDDCNNMFLYGGCGSQAVCYADGTCGGDHCACLTFG